MKGKKTKTQSKQAKIKGTDILRQTTSVRTKRELTQEEKLRASSAQTGFMKELSRRQKFREVYQKAKEAGQAASIFTGRSINPGPGPQNPESLTKAKPSEPTSQSQDFVDRARGINHAKGRKDSTEE